MFWSHLSLFVSNNFNSNCHLTTMYQLVPSPTGYLCLRLFHNNKLHDEDCVLTDLSNDWSICIIGLECMLTTRIVEVSCFMKRIFRYPRKKLVTMQLEYNSALLLDRSLPMWPRHSTLKGLCKSINYTHGNAVLKHTLYKTCLKIRSVCSPTVTYDIFLIRAMFNLLSHGFLNKYKLSY